MNAKFQLYTLVMILIVLVSTGCSAMATSMPTPTSTAVPTSTIVPPTVTPTIEIPTNTPLPPTLAAECSPTDQDAYVFAPGRLQVQSPCIHVVGIVKGAYDSDDGDGIIDLDLDPTFKHFLVPANFTTLFNINGTLHVEIICHAAKSESICAQNPDPLRQPLPKVGQHIWAEGRWVLDWGHTGYAELHPVYRWGVVQ